MTPDEREAVTAVLERSRRLGFLGPGSLRVQVDHALGFARGAAGPPDRFLDLGSGGGVPGLVLALWWPDSRAVLLDASARRCAFLGEAIDELGCGARVTVVRARAEEVGRRDGLREGFDLVVARGFGPPAVTAECAAPLLRVGGRLIVSEPPATGGPQGGHAPDHGSADGAVGRPDAGAVGGRTGGSEDGPDETPPGDDRWPAGGLALLGLRPGDVWREPFHYRSFVLAQPCPRRFPRRVGVPAKRPLF